MDITKDIRSLTEFKRDTSRFVAHLKDTGRPAILTVNGRPELVVMDAAAWQEMQERVDFAQAVAGIRRGLEDAEAGLVEDAEAFFDKLGAERRK